MCGLAIRLEKELGMEKTVGIAAGYQWHWQERLQKSKGAP